MEDNRAIITRRGLNKILNFFLYHFIFLNDNRSFRGCIRKNSNDTEKISMAPAQGRHTILEVGLLVRVSIFNFNFFGLSPLTAISVLHPGVCTTLNSFRFHALSLVPSDRVVDGFRVSLEYNPEIIFRAYQNVCYIEGNSCPFLDAFQVLH